jgi:type IV secretion system protein VirB11
MSASAAVIEARSSLDYALEPLRPLLGEPELTELCINRPGEAFIERNRAWTRVPLPIATFEWCLRLAKLIAHASRQRISAGEPLLSAALPSGERVQIAIPPATAARTVAIAIRRPAAVVWTVAELAAAGLFARTRRAGEEAGAIERTLAALYAERRFEELMRVAVLSRQNILISGPTGSGKTTWTKALIREIPADERLITIEDAAELVLDRHANHVRLFYSKDGQGLSQVTPKELLESCLRLRPDRILLAELRGEEAFYYLRNVSSGHPGSITSIHAGSCQLAFEQLVLMVKQSPGGRGLAREDIYALVRSLVDVVIQFGVEGGRRGIEEIEMGRAARD